jgi:hypothetical protein
MTKKTRITLLLALLFIYLPLATCLKQETASEKTTNPAFVIDKLFEHEGCAVYRFYAGGRAHYYSRCIDVASSRIHSYSADSRGQLEQTLTTYE